MKKQYIQPRTKIHALRPSRMCEGSIPMAGTSQDNTVYSKEEVDGNFGW